jgi:hypothetical protein
MYRCKNCKYLQRWDRGKKIIIYCSFYKSNKNEIVKISKDRPACKYFEKINEKIYKNLDK